MHLYNSVTPNKFVNTQDNELPCLPPTMDENGIGPPVKLSVIFIVTEFY